MARKKKHEEHENHERWLVSYADFITLLFAFFVVMYSISSVNEGKYRVLSESMLAAFRSSTRAIDPIQVGQLVRSPRSTQPVIVEEPKPLQLRKPIINLNPFPKPEQDPMGGNRWAMDKAAGQIEAMAGAVEESLDSLIEQGLVTVRRNRLSLEVEINTSILFASASAAPSVDAEYVLRRLARLLSPYPNHIHVEGFTDDRPISNSFYPSNWELSSGRAAAVVRLFADYGIEPRRMASVGYGQFRPIAGNDTALGRARNRRVVVVVVADFRNPSEPASYSEFEVLSQSLRRQTDPQGPRAEPAPETMPESAPPPQAGSTPAPSPDAPPSA